MCCKKSDCIETSVYQDEMPIVHILQGRNGTVVWCVLESEINILCENHEVCPEVMIALQDMGFTRLKDVSDSLISFDITAKRDFQDEKDEQETINKVFSRCGNKIHQIQVTRKNSRSS